MNDCRYGVSPVNYPDPDPDPEGDTSVVVYSNCQCTSAFGLPLTYCPIYLE